MPEDNVVVYVELTGKGCASHMKGIGRQLQVCLVPGEIYHPHNIA